MSLAFPRGIASFRGGVFGPKFFGAVEDLVGIHPPGFGSLIGRPMSNKRARTSHSGSHSVADVDMFSGEEHKGGNRGSSRRGAVRGLRPVSARQADLKQASSIQRLHSDVQRLKRASRADIHHVTTSATITTSVAWKFSNLSEIAQGDDHDDRSGNRVFLKYFQMRGHVANGVLSAIQNIIRVVIFRSKKSLKGTAPVFTDLFDENGLNALYANRGSAAITGAGYEILLDKVFTVEALDASVHSRKPFWFKKKLNWNQSFDGVALDDFDLDSLWIATASQVVNVNAATVQFKARVSFNP